MTTSDKMKQGGEDEVNCHRSKYCYAAIVAEQR